MTEKNKNTLPWICGWLSPEGDFTKCSHEEHRYIAKTKFGCKEEELEDKGFIKLTFSIWFSHEQKVIAYKRPTQQQIDFLESEGLLDFVEELKYNFGV